MSPQPAPYRPATAILSLGDAHYDRVTAADFPAAVLRFRNDRCAEAVGLGGLGDESWVRHFGRFQALPDNLPEPLALRYHGHQFRMYNPDLGDGRGFLFAQVRDADGRLLDLGTKGSGQTPWSRFGDGRLTLKGGVREVLATEMLEALGVNTSKSFSLIETGEALERGDEPSPTRSAVLVRLSHGHIRIGSFQRLAWLSEPDAMRALVDYCLANLLDDEPGGDDAPARLLGHVVRRVAVLAASYMAAGFVHGVLNSDNIAITAESFDYGPWRFAPTWDADFTAAYFDHHGLYAFGRQAEAIHWDVVQLAIALRSIADEDALLPRIEPFAALYRTALTGALLARLGIAPAGELEDAALSATIEEALAAGSVGLDRFFFDWVGGKRRAPSPADAAYAAPPFEALAAALATRAPAGPFDHPYWADAEPCSLLIEKVEAIWSAIAERDDWAPFHAKIAGIRRMGQALAQVSDRSATAHALGQCLSLNYDGRRVPSASL